MGENRGSFLSGLVLVAAGALLSPGSLLAVQHEVRILLDLDADAATGCTVATVDGPFAGVEQILITTVDTTSPPPAGTVTDVAVSDCVSPATDTFGPPASFDGGWPVGVDLGVGGLDVVETYMPLVSSSVQDPKLIRLGLVVTDELGGEQALLTVDDSPGGPAILLDLRSAIEIPTLAEWGLILLALLLAGASLRLLGRRGTAAAALVLAVLVAGVAWAAVNLDGLTDDWSTGDQLASNGMVLFGKGAGPNLCFRVDLELLFNTAPTADPQSVTTPEDTPAAITLTGSDPESDPLTFTLVPGSGPDHGTLTGAPPNVTYTPDPDYNGPDGFDFQVEDPSGAIGSATVSITVTPVNDAPVAQDDAFTTPEDTQLAGDVLADNGSGADSDVDGDSLTVNTTPVSAPTDGTLVLNADGTFTYDPDPDFNGADSFQYEVLDGNGGADVGLVAITVTSVNDAPVARDDAFTTAEDVQLSGGNVLSDNGFGADSDDDGDPLTVTTTPVSGPTDGTLVLNADGTFTYDPDPDFNGADSFVYEVADGNGGSDTATVTITVTAVNDDPTAVDDSFLVTEDSVNNALDVLANDDDAPDTGETLTVTGVGAPDQGGSVAINGTNDGLVYTPAANFAGNETFTYDIADGNGGTATATVTVAVSAVNDAPVVDLDADDSGGTAGTGYAVAYTEDDGAVAAVDPADATIADVDGASLDSLTVTLQNLLDTGEELLAATSGDPDITVEPYDTTTVPGQGILRLTTTTPQLIADFVTVLRTVTYEHSGDAPDTSVARTIAFVADDGIDAGPAAISTVTLTAVNDAPVAQDDAYSTPEDTQLVAGSVLDDNGSGADSDADGDPLTVNTTPVSGPSSGTLVLNADGTFTYDPNLNFNGSDSFVYEVTDGNTGSDTATVTITVTAVNDAPVAQDDAFTTVEDTQLTGGNVLADNGSGIDDDVDGDTLTVNTTPVSGPSNGMLTLNADGTFTYDPGLDFNGSDSFVYEVTDGNTGSDTATVTITVTAVNDAPVAQDDAFTTAEDTQLSGGNVLADNGSGIDDDVDGDTLTVNTTPVSGPSSGTLVLNADGTFTYDPNLNFNGSDSFVYEVTDGNTGSDTATVTITVTAVNDAPVAQDDAFTTAEDTQLSGGNVLADNGAGVDDDVDGDTLTVTTTPVSGPSNGTLVLSADGTFTYDPALNFNGSDSFVYEVTDGNTGSDTATVTITVTAVNDSPTAVDDPVATDEDTAITILVLGNDDDPDTGDTLTIIAVNGATGGVVNNGTDLSYDPTAAFNSLAQGSSAIDSFTYTIQDSGGLQSTATVTVTVGGLNDAPVADDETYSAVGNTRLAVAKTGPFGAPTYVSSLTHVLNGDTDPDTGDSVSAVAFSGDPAGGPVGDLLNLAADGSFFYTPAPGHTAPTTFDYTVQDTFGATDTGSVTINVAKMVWYVDNSANGGAVNTGAGTSTDPFSTLSDGAGNVAADDAEDASAAGHIVYVFQGSGTTNLDQGIALKSQQKLWGEGVSLVVDIDDGGPEAPQTLFTGNPANKPHVTRSGLGDAVNVLADTTNGNRVGVEIRGLQVSSASGNAIDVTSANAAGLGVTIADNTISGAALEGVDVNVGSTSTAQTLAIHENSFSAAGAALDVTRTAGTVTITSFHDNTVSGASAGAGLRVIGPATFDADPSTGGIQSVPGGTTVIGAPGNGIGGPGLTLTSVTGALNFANAASGTIGAGDLDVFTDSGAALTASGVGGFDLDVTPNAGVLVANAGPAAVLSGLDANLVLSSLTSTNSGAQGVSLTSVTGTFSAPSGSSITNAAGVAFDIDAGTAVVTYGGSITNSAARSIEVTNRSGSPGAVTFSGSINDTGAGILVSGNSAGTIALTSNTKTFNTGANGAVSLSNNAGATINFSGGGLDVDTTTGTGFSATGGATAVTVTGAGNSINSVSAPALNVVNTTIGASGLNFATISSGNNTVAAEPANGIVLNNTGAAGGLTSSGGTIQNTTGDGISLTSTRNVSLSNMTVSDAGRHGIFGTGVTNFTLTGANVTGAGDAAGEHALAFHSLGVNNLLGTATISASTISGMHQHGITVENVSGTLTMTVNDTTISNNHSTEGGDGILFQADGTANMTLNVGETSPTGCAFSNLNADAVQVNTEGSPGGSTATLSINGCEITSVGGGTGAIAVTGINSSANTASFDIRNNTLTNVELVGLAIAALDDSELTGSILNNIVNGTGAEGIFIAADGGPSVLSPVIRVAVRGNNVIGQPDINGIRVRSRDGNGGIVHIQLEGNTVAAPTDDLFGGADGINIRAEDAMSICLDVQDVAPLGSNNTSAGTNEGGGSGLVGYRLSDLTSGTFALEGFAAGTVANFFSAQNNVGSVATSGTIAMNGSCDTP